MTELKCQGPIFFRGSLSSGGYFTEVFAVVERGRLDLYAKKKHYLNHENPINAKSILLHQYRLETNYRQACSIMPFCMCFIFCPNLQAL